MKRASTKEKRRERERRGHACDVVHSAQPESDDSGSVVVILHKCVAVILHKCVAVILHKCVAVILHSSVAVILHSSVAVILHIIILLVQSYMYRAGEATDRKRKTTILSLASVHGRMREEKKVRE